MSREPSGRRELTASLADEILQHYGTGRVIVAVDGADSSATAVLASALVVELHKRGLTAFHASVDDFQAPRARWNSDGAATAIDRYRAGFDYSALRRVLIDPFRLGGSTGFVAAHFDAGRDTLIQPKWLSAADDAILVVDGLYLQRPELRGLWNYTIWVDAAAGEEPLKQYLKEAKPRDSASALIDAADPDHPRRVFSDSC